MEKNFRRNSDESWIKMMELGHKLGCHQLAHRSFFYKEYQFPVCARCTGVIISSIIAMIMFFFYPINFLIAILLSFIMFIDWFIQYIEIKESTNTRRFATGILGGYGFMTLQMYFYTYIIKVCINCILMII